ncbi:hypothetical protein GCM10009654_34720 [Streptomyces hebeiensis]|uniref:Secreted protein n=1 Tax=Streptomyces hebeiensis TaxID=229486 RepID=A0ABN1UVY5_9ACTN
MSRGIAKYNKRRVLIAGGAAAVVLSGAVIVSSAMAGEGDSGQAAADGRTAASPGSVNCPDVAPSLPAIPASAQAEVDRNLALLNTQIGEANQRLIDTVGQGGANFVQNAILGPLEDKRVATINRIATAIGRTAEKPAGLDSLAACTLNTGAAGEGAGAGDAGNAGGDAGAGDAGAGDAGAGEAGAGNAGAGAGDAGAGAGDAGAGAGDAGAGNAGGDAGNAGGDGAGGATGASTVNCPDVAPSLPAIPASAQAEVDRNLALLDTQISEANQRLIDTVGQGGPNFVQNAILGPLEDKRVATINRIATAIGRTAEKPAGLDSLGACTLNG